MSKNIYLELIKEHIKSKVGSMSFLEPLVFDNLLSEIYIKSIDDDTKEINMFDIKIKYNNSFSNYPIDIYLNNQELKRIDEYDRSEIKEYILELYLFYYYNNSVYLSLKK